MNGARQREPEVARAYATAASSLFRRLTECQLSPATADRAFARLMRLRRAREIAAEAIDQRVAAMAAATGGHGR